MNEFESSWIWQVVLLILQLVGGGGYFLNKYFFYRAEQSIALYEGRWRAWAWRAYIIGLAPIVIIFALKERWIAASVEASGLPAMIYGLLVAGRIGETTKKPLTLRIVAWTMVLTGVYISYRDAGSLTLYTQYMELGVAVGYLLGTALLAEKKAIGYLFFMLMNVSCGALMYHDGYYLMVAQQAASLYFVVLAFRTHRGKVRGTLWHVEGYDSLEEQYYPLAKNFLSERAARRDAKKWLRRIQETQPVDEAGEHEMLGIQDMVFVVRPDGKHLLVI